MEFEQSANTFIYWLVVGSGKCGVARPSSAPRCSWWRGRGSPPLPRSWASGWRLRPRPPPPCSPAPGSTTNSSASRVWTPAAASLWRPASPPTSGCSCWWKTPTSPQQTGCQGEAGAKPDPEEGHQEAAEEGVLHQGRQGAQQAGQGGLPRARGRDTSLE